MFIYYKLSFVTWISLDACFSLQLSLFFAFFLVPAHKPLGGVHSLPSDSYNTGQVFGFCQKLPWHNQVLPSGVGSIFLFYYVRLA